MPRALLLAAFIPGNLIALKRNFSTCGPVQVSTTSWHNLSHACNIAGKVLSLDVPKQFSPWLLLTQAMN